MCIPRKIGSASGDVSGVVGGYTFYFLKSPSLFLTVEKSRNERSLLGL